MVILFISIGTVAVVCTTGAVASCQTMPISVLTGMVVAGVVELIFEVKGLVKIYKNKNDDE